MKDTTETGAPSPNSPKDNYLTPTNTKSTEKLSLHSDTRSIKSGITVVGDDPAVADKPEIRRKSTWSVNVKLSRLDCFLGLFSLGKLKRKIERSIEIKGLEVKEPEPTYSPWILPVYVAFPEKHGRRRSEYQAQCTIDTGNMQGNLVSRDFLLRLGCTESDFEPLTNPEKNGGTAITGHSLVPEGAVFLTWFHRNSTCVFHDMRFLVSPHAHCDLVIGARSIAKHNLLCPPNLMNSEGMTFVKPESDEALLDLERVKAKLANDLTTYKNDLEREKGRGNNNTRIKKLGLKISKTEKDLKVAELKLDLYNSKKALDRSPTETNRTLVNVLEGDLRDAESNPQAPPADVAPVNVPPIMVTGPGRTFTFSSIKSLSRHNTLSLLKI